MTEPPSSTNCLGYAPRLRRHIALTARELLRNRRRREPCAAAALFRRLVPVRPHPLHRRALGPP